MSDINYDINYGAIPPVTVSIDSAQQSKIMADIATLNSAMSSGSSPTQYTFTTNGTGGTGSYNPFNGYKNGGVVSSGSSGQFLATGAGGTSWNTGTVVNINADGLTMKKGADIKIGGKSLTEAIEKIEERLGILSPNSALEERWDKLKELRQQYVEMERDLLEKEKLMKILKET
jgi:hypothetical protein